MRRWLGDEVKAADAASSQVPARRDPVFYVIGCGALLIVAIIVGTAVAVGKFRDSAVQDSERELQSTAILLARHFDQQFGDLRRVQQSLQVSLHASGINSSERFAPVMNSYQMHQRIKAALGDRSSGELNVMDATGKLINWTQSWPAPDLNVADRKYFQALRSNASTDVEFTEPVLGRISGNWKTVFARRLSGPNGEFLGVVARTVDPTHIEQFFGSIALGENSAISMIHRDGTLLARYPRPSGNVGAKPPNGPLLDYLQQKSGPAIIRLVSPIDGLDRLGAVQSLNDFPIVVMATTPVDSVLTAWRDQTRFLISTSALSALVITAMMLFIIKQVSRQHRTMQAQLTLEKHRLNTAINNMPQGLVMFDAQTRLVIRNERYLSMYEHSPDRIVPGMLFRDVVAARRSSRSFRGDVDAYVAEALGNQGKASSQQLETGDGHTIVVSMCPLADGGWVATHDDITDRRRAEERIEHLAHYDALTDLPNRVLFVQQLEHELTRVARGEHCAVIYLDIDEFKSINDSLGHPIGDELLKSVAQRLKACVRACDVVARLGGDEFAIVQTGITEQSNVIDLVARIHDAIREPFECGGHRLLSDASIGIALAPLDGTDLETLLKNADLAMYSAKAGGRRTYRFFEPEMDARVQARRALELDLRQAITDDAFEAGGFEVYYQPLLSLQDDVITGCEALLRWRHPLRGMISPSEFIPVAEETGLIDKLGEWVLTTACMEAANWPDAIKIAVNISPVQFGSQALALKVAAALAASGLPARRLELEITEAVLIRDDNVALTILHSLRELGVRIALDDFGTGYSSLSYLQRFQFDKIKIDRCFVANITEPNGSASIVQAVVNIASSRNMTTTAEGVETNAQKEILRTLDCTEMQGWLFSAARPAAEIRALISAHRQRTSSAA